MYKIISLNNQVRHKQKSKANYLMNNMNSKIILEQTLSLKQKIKRNNDKSNKLYSQIVEELLKKIRFLQHSRDSLLQENRVLKTKLQNFQTNQTLQFCIDAYQSRNSVLFQQVSDMTDNLLVQTQQSQILLCPNESQQMKQYQQSNKWITNKKSQIQKLLFTQGIRTPILYEPIFKNHYYRAPFSLKGLIRSFYIKILTLPQCIMSLISIIEDEYMKNYDKIYLFSKYPDNTIIGNLMIDFLNKVTEMTSLNEVIKRIHQFKLYDDILYQIILHSLDTFIDTGGQIFNLQVAEKCFFGLSNIFDLQFIRRQNNFQFYRELENKKRLNSEESQISNKVHEEISLNPRQSYDFKADIAQQHSIDPLFQIIFNYNLSKFEFFVKQQILIPQSQLYSKQNDKQENSQNKAKQFNSKSSNKVIFQKNYNYFLDIHEVFESQKKIKTPDSKQSERMFHEIISKLKRNKYGSHQSSMLLSSYNNSFRCSKDLFNSKQLKGKLNYRYQQNQTFSSKKDNEQSRKEQNIRITDSLQTFLI